MKEILTIFSDYCGTGIYPFLFLVALIYLLIMEKDRKIRIVLVECSLVILILFFLPLFKNVMELVEEAGTYYRILWLLPMTAVIAYAGVRMIGRYTRTGLVALTVLCVLGGDYLYDNPNVSKAQNKYHIPAEAAAICEEIRPAEDEERVWAVFPSELIHFVRQYTTDIQMPYGREHLVDTWGRIIDHPMYLLMEAETVELELLAELADDYTIHYIILNKAKTVHGEAEECGLERIAEIGGYDVYQNMSVEIWKKS